MDFSARTVPFQSSRSASKSAFPENTPPPSTPFFPSLEPLTAKSTKTTPLRGAKHLASPAWPQSRGPAQLCRNEARSVKRGLRARSGATRDGQAFGGAFGELSFVWRA